MSVNKASWTNHLGKNRRIATYVDSIGRMDNFSLSTATIIGGGISTLRVTNGRIYVILFFRCGTKPSSSLSQPQNASNFTFECRVVGRRSKCRRCSPSPSVFFYYTNWIINSTQLKSNTIWLISRSECVFINIMSFLATCRDSIGQRSSRNLRLTNTGVIVQLSSPFDELFEHFNFFQVVRSSVYDDRPSCLSYQRVK